MIIVEIQAGVCGFASTVKADSQDMQTVDIEFSTQCPNLKPLEQELKQVSAFAEAFGKVGDTSVYQIARTYCKHAACPVPMAIVKAVEAAAGLALPRDVHVSIRKQES